MIKYPILVLFVIISLKVFAVADTTSMRHFSIENGLPSNNVYAVTQDKYGYIWFNTDNGVVKYNGYSFKLFTIADGLPSNDVWKLYPDKMGRLWVCTHSYKIGYIKNDKYVNVISSNDKAIHPFSLTSDDKKNVKFFYHEGDLTPLVTIDSNDKLTKIYIDTMSPRPNMGALSDDGKAMLVLGNFNNNKIFFSTYSNGSYRFYPKQISFAIQAFNSRYGGIECYNGRLLNIPEFSDHILFVDSNSSVFKSVYFSELGGEKDEVMYVRYVADDSLFIITNKAIYSVDLYFKSFKRLSTTHILPINSQIAYYFVDKQSNKWYATTNDGVWVRFSNLNLFTPDNSLTQLFDSKCIGLLRNGMSFWLNGKRSIVYELNAAQKIRIVRPPLNNIPRKIVYRNDSEVYFCTDKGTYIYNVKTTRYKSIANYFSLDTVKRYRQILRPPVVTDAEAMENAFGNFSHLYPINENMWLSYSLNPDWVFTEITGRTAKLTTLDVEHYSNIWFDSTDNLYLFNNINKAAIYNPVNNRYTYINSSLLQQLDVNYILGIVSDSYSNIYLLDNSKIVVYNLKKGRIGYVKCNFNLADASMQVYKNRLLVTGKFGIAFANINGPLSISDFQVTANIDNYSRVYDFMVSNTGIVYLTTDKGIVDFPINNLLKSRKLIQPSTPNFFRLVASATLPRSIVYGDTITIPQSIPKINLDAINSLGNGNVQYSYFIEGGGDWQQSNTGEIFVGNLKANHYYKFECLVKDSRWVSNRVVFYVFRAPYWWQTTRWIIVFLICGAFLFIGFVLVIVLLTRYIVARSNEKKRVLTELELRAVYAQINPHFIFNTLSAALYFINRRKFDDAYVHVNKFSRLIRGYLKSSQDRYIPLSEEIEMLKTYIELQKTRFEGKFEYKMEI
ncbi:MAG: histidine kinase, partial [Bacteroidetes bacterium]|nr:histidine kinase [Bacteroidota bacterium]